MWKQVKGYEGFYEVSDCGEVRSVDRYLQYSNGIIYHHKGRILKQSILKGRGDTLDRKGYCVVNLRKLGTTKVCCVHILVAQAFIPNVEDKPVVNHKDGNKRNNSVDNLEWVSFSDNNRHALRTGLRAPRGNRIEQYTLSGTCIMSYKSSCEAERQTGISHLSISHCLNGRQKTAGGFIWRKASEGQTTIP